MAVIGIIGGSGLDNPDILKDAKDSEVSNKWGEPSSPIRSGKIAGKEVHIIGRHGREHTIPPTYVNNRANIQALKDLGCDYILATTAVGSLREEIDRGHLVIIDQFIDFTRKRELTFFESFEPHAPAHTPMAEPFDADMRAKMTAACNELGVTVHDKGTVVTIEGPRFSTRAESHMFRAWGADIINMSTAPEAILANEAGIPYAAVAMSTDYDCWKTDEAPVTWDDILAIFKANAENVTSMLIKTIENI
ncbi:S-methyl-5'-thioadenosine phosphorylase [Desulfovibrio sp. JC010]|uniref:S-methyl-5'-thioadenosine phosphorylase n=1 Tax=Desulfovibrio sp. JC010 TaxID=2593641 RepID=UPI0013CF691B|nr:S-methyl-5'-thioadenosine phosphorylase [Desulfovibrio sp. JC010]NDV27383.1 S-methyl-5'-thioadenosine phosphorylase [Desulfovibrio sp. JC010]